jgi:D-tagatose-1,6-bisphosphate aldolase subunit GatZ/KbaZ
MNQLIDKNYSGMCSICSAHEYVLRSACREAAAVNSKLLIESTSNQVNQFGGYTFMKPHQFVNYVKDIAKNENLPFENLILGGDHLGPNPWQNEDAESAMSKAEELTRQCVQAGYTKIHLDTSMRCLHDPGEKDKALDVIIIAERAAELCQIAEQTSQEKQRLTYVIGTDVPVPGGAQEELYHSHITPVEQVKKTIDITKQAFVKHGLEEAWDRVIAIVVQPGVEFGDASVIEYDRNKAAELSSFIENYDNLVYEAHSTDYQTQQALKEMVEDHFAILKVGPWLTFAFRETIFALASIEKELFRNNRSTNRSDLLSVIEQQMVENPIYWQNHYHGDESDLRIARKYSYSDRIRYYWPNEKISNSLNQLIRNLSNREIPLSMLSQFLPFQYKAIRNGQIKNDVWHLIHYGLKNVLDIYSYATLQNSKDKRRLM